MNLKKYKFYSNIKNLNKKKWINFYSTHTNFNIYQTFEMFEFWRSNKSSTSFIFLLESDTGECLSFCTGAIVFKGKGRIKLQSKSAIIYGGPLINENKNKREILNYLLPRIEKYLKLKSKYIEFRNLYLDESFKEIFAKNKWRYTPKVNYVVSLTTEKEVFSRFNRNKRKQIRRALKEDIQISHDKTHGNIKGVFDVIKIIYLKNFNDFLLPLPDLSFLMNLLVLKQAGLTAVIHNDKVIGGEIFLMDEKVIYGWFGGGLNVEYKKQSPMSVSNWATMKYGLENNLKVFDYGGAGIKDKENRLREYKSAFGGELIENGMFSKINLPFVYKIENGLNRLL